MIHQGDCLEVMKQYSDNHFTNILTDPPYGLSFMGKKWDHSVPGKEFWVEALRICKPGAIMLAFGGTRTYHRLACAIEDAGWEIRDCLMWIYGSGFPKSHNHFGFEGYGTALKPAYEPIIMAMKPLDGTFAQNAEKWGVAGINIDACRIETTEKLSIGTGKVGYEGGYINYNPPNQHSGGRWPANTLFDEQAAEMLDEQSGNRPSSSGSGASRFFYCAKASTSERNGSTHPTMKPLKVLEYLLKLITPPKNALVLDPFAGSGSTLVAAKNLGIACEGIEISEEYCQIAKSRINQ